MRVCCLLLLATCTLFACDDAVVAVTTSNQKVVTSTDNIPATKNLRSYDMSELDKDDASEEERAGFDVKKLIEASKIDDALKDATKKEELFTSWAKTSLLSDDVVKALATNPQNEKLIQSFKEYRTKVSAQADELLQNPTKITETMKDFEKREEMFKTWFANEAVTDEIVARLSKNWDENKKVILAFNDYRTKFTYGLKLDGWLQTRDMDTILQGMKVSGTNAMKKTFAEWHAHGKTGDDLTKALTGHPDLEKKYKMLTVAYPGFIKQQEKLAKAKEELAKRNAELAKLVKVAVETG